MLEAGEASGCGDYPLEVSVTRGSAWSLKIEGFEGPALRAGTCMAIVKGVASYPLPRPAAGTQKTIPIDVEIDGEVSTFELHLTHWTAILTKSSGSKMQLDIDESWDHSRAIILPPDVAVLSAEPLNRRTPFPGAIEALRAEAARRGWASPVEVYGFPQDEWFDALLVVIRDGTRIPKRGHVYLSGTRNPEIYLGVEVPERSETQPR